MNLAAAYDEVVEGIWLYAGDKPEDAEFEAGLFDDEKLEDRVRALFEGISE